MTPENALLELDDIQSGVLRPRPTPYAATYIVLRIDNPAAGRELMRRVSTVVSPAANPTSPLADTWVSVALTYEGLKALGVPSDSLDSFAPEFQQGMAARARELGDTGESSPENWEKPLGTPDVHVVLAALAPDAKRLGIALDSRGFVQVDDYLRTSSPHIFAAGDITGRLMLVPEAIQDGFVAATNAILGTNETRQRTVSPIGSFTDPEYAQVGLTEVRARETHKPLVVKINFDSATRTIIDGRTTGFCKLIVDRETRGILGCHVVGERAVEIAQVASIVIASGMRVEDLARVPLSFPTYAGVLGRLAASATRQLNLSVSWQANQVGP